MDRAIRQMTNAGLAWSREDFPWQTIEPQPGRYCWGDTDRLMSRAAAAGLSVIAVPDGAPVWVTGDPFRAPTGGSALSAYCDLVRELLARYGSEGSFWHEHPDLTPRPLRLVDVWNEPYTARFWHGHFPDPVGYARMFESVVRSARPVDPSARFLLEADTTAIDPDGGQTAFLRRMLTRVPAAVQGADAVSVHPYASNGWGPNHCTPPGSMDRRFEVCRLGDIRSELEGHGVHIPLWITEIGWREGRGAGGVSQARRARYLHDFFAYVREQYGNQAAGIIWYSYTPSSLEQTSGEGSFGLVDGVGASSPGWTALAREAATPLSSRAAAGP